MYMKGLKMNRAQRRQAKKHNRKKNPNKVPVSKADLIKWRKQFEADKENITNQATSDATLYDRAIIYKALHDAYGFAQDDYAKLLEAETKIGERLGDENDTYTFDDIAKELSEYGVTVVEKNVGN